MNFIVVFNKWIDGVVGPRSVIKWELTRLVFNFLSINALILLIYIEPNTIGES